MSTITRDGVDSLAMGRKEPDWLKKARVAAWEHYLSLPAPAVRDDAWRKTRYADLDLSKVTTSSVVDRAEQEQIPAAAAIEKSMEKVSGLITFTEKGSFRARLNPELEKKGVAFVTMSQSLEETPELARQWLAGASENSDKFEAMARALCNCGALLHVPDGVEIEAPFLIVHCLETSTEGSATFPRILIKAGANARFRAVTVFTSPFRKRGAASSVLSFVDALVELELGPGAALDYVEIQDFSDDVFFVSKSINRIGKDAAVKSLTTGLGGYQLKGVIETELNERGAQSSIQAVVLGSEEEHLSYNTIQKHNAPDTASNINFLVALKDRAVSAYQGNIMVAREAQRTDAFQSNKNLLLGDKAKADSIPRLEILADDVKCSHGATVGPVDKDQVFYLMARGLDRKTAEELVVSGFFNTVLERNPVPQTGAWIEGRLRDKIHGSEK